MHRTPLRFVGCFVQFNRGKAAGSGQQKEVSDMEMRRKEREIKDAAQITAFLEGEQIMRVAFYDDGEIYIVPLNYGMVQENGRYIFYFHGAGAGRKFTLAQAAPQVGFEVDGAYRLLPAETACGHSCVYQSVIGTGRLTVVDDPAEKITGLQAVMRQATGKADWDIPSAAAAAVAVLRLDAEQLTCKARPDPAAQLTGKERENG